MISLSVHSVKSIVASAKAHGPDNNWVNVMFIGCPDHFDITVFFDRDKEAAEAYAAAINGVNVPSVKVDEQEAA